MIYITQLVYINEGQAEVFHAFEDNALPAISKYNGQLLLRIRPDENAFITHAVGKPYEIHLVEFNSEEDFENFKKDEDRVKFLHLKEQAVKTSILIQGKKL